MQHSLVECASIILEWMEMDCYRQRERFSSKPATRCGMQWQKKESAADSVFIGSSRPDGILVLYVCAYGGRSGNNEGPTCRTLLPCFFLGGRFYFGQSITTCLFGDPSSRRRAPVEGRVFFDFLILSWRLLGGLFQSSSFSHFLVRSAISFLSRGFLWSSGTV